MPIFAEAEAEAKIESKEKQEKKGLFGFIKRDKSKTQTTNTRINTSKKDEKKEDVFSDIKPDEVKLENIDEKPLIDESESKKEENTEKKTANEEEKTKDTNDELKVLTDTNKIKKEGMIDVMNFIQPSIEISKDEQTKIDSALSKVEQEQLLILWRATLERNKTIRFIVQKLAPNEDDKKKNQVLSQILNTAVFLPFYAIQSVAPADTSALASYLGAGVASDIISGVSKKNKDKLILTQTEMVIMFMMIDEIAERVRQQYSNYKREMVDLLLAKEEMEAAKKEAEASLQINSPEAQFLSQIRIRQIEREVKRTEARLRSFRITLLDLCGNDALAQVDKLIEKEIKVIAAI